MSVSSDLPDKCSECIKSSKPIIHTKCGFCQDLKFREEVLCHLNRSIQNTSTFACHAYQPKLKLVGAGAQKASLSSEGFEKKHSKILLRKVLGSDKIKYERALFLQRLGRDEDAVFVSLKYHVVWNVIHRISLFRPPSELFACVSDVFSSYAELAGGFVSLLWLAPDHLHLYVESDGEDSIEIIVQKMKRQSTSAIRAECSDLLTKLDVNSDLWDKAYFVETVG